MGYHEECAEFDKEHDGPACGCWCHDAMLD